MISLLRFVLVGVLCLAPAGIACAQLPPYVLLTVDYYPDRVATPYDFVVVLSSVIDNDAVTIGAPDGTIFEAVPDRGFFHRFENQTAADLNRYIGSWTINDSQGLPDGAAPKQHSFYVSQRDLTRPPSMPHIVSPQDGAVLPPIFEIKMSHSGLRVRSPEGPGSLKRLSLWPGVGRYQYLFNPGITEVDIEARALNGETEIRGASAPEQANRRFTVWMNSYIYAPPSTFTVRVPEPAALTMGCFASLGLAALRRRK